MGTGADQIRADVAIVGGGPVGMVLAMQLDAWGVSTVLINRETTSRWHPKGNTHNARTMEHYRRLGISENIRQLGLPADCATDVVYYTRFNSHEIARIRMPSAAEKRAAVAAADPTDQVPEPIHRANQMYVERFLFDHLASLRHADIRFGWICTGFKDKGDSVALEIESADGQAAATVACAWLVGCDGGNGSTRRALGIRYEGEGSLDQAFFGKDMLSTYLRAPGIHRDIIKRPAWQYWAVSHDLRAALVDLDGQDEFLMLGRLREGETPDNDHLAQLVSDAAGQPVAVEIIDNLGWTGGQALVAERFGQGRVLLAGDAVHLFTPTGGFGMNTGLDDTANLAWKLAAEVQGWGGPALVASYEAERRPVALRNTGAAHALARNVGDVPTAPEMLDDSPAGEAARREAGNFLAGFGEEFASIGIQLGARYDGSPVIAGDGAPPPPDDPAIYVPSSVPGGRAPHVWLDSDDGKRESLFDRFAQGFSLLCLGRSAGDAAALADAAASRNIPFAAVPVPGEPARDLYGCDYALVRPDQHVAWRGNDLPEDAGGLLDKVTGREAL
jgi:2-polyprenyl-6-methoxyphenol hydroxylase-like FAD-dependent oxidoreductase